MRFVWDIDPVLLHLGPLELRYYGLLFSLVFIGGFLLFGWQVRRAGGSEDDVYQILIPGALGTIIGARLGHVLFYEPGHMLADPLWVLMIWKGGLASHGALIGLVLAVWWYARNRGQTFLECADRFSFPTAWGTMLVRIGNFFNSEIVGRVTHGDYGVRFPRWDNLPVEQTPWRHPSQLYEAALGLIVMFLLLAVDRWMGREKRPRGVLTAVFLTVYFGGRFFLEFFKEYEGVPPDFPLTMGQMLSIPATLAGLVLLVVSLRRRIPAEWVRSAPLPEETTAPKPRPDKPRGGRHSRRR